MKNLVTCLIVLATTFGFSQIKIGNGMLVKKTTKVENVAVTVTVDSVEDIEKTFKVEDINRILENTDDDEALSFKIVCNGKTMSNGKKAHLSYKIKGNSNEVDVFLKGVEKLRASAINYYNNKD